jgi:hypothetical protein
MKNKLCHFRSTINFLSCIILLHVIYETCFSMVMIVLDIYVAFLVTVYSEQVVFYSACT